MCWLCGPGAKGYEDENGPRMINTPWYEEPIPFHEAAEIGTRKVIQEHSTLGVVITTDGTIGEIPRVIMSKQKNELLMN